MSTKYDPAPNRAAVAAAVRVNAGRWRRAWACAILALLSWWAAPAVAQQPDADMINREYPLKALFLYNFGSYIEWPATVFASSENTFVIGVLGSAPLDRPMQEIAATKKIGGRTISVQKFNSVDTIGPCQILFVSRDVTPQQQAQIVSKFQQDHILIVGESKDFASRGAIINFYVEDNKIKFEINPNTAKQHQLKISSKLLALAKIVQK